MHERDLRTLREGVDMLEGGLRRRSEESTTSLRRIDGSLESIEDIVAIAETKGVEAADLAGLRSLVPQLRGEVNELKGKLGMGDAKGVSESNRADGDAEPNGADHRPTHIQPEVLSPSSSGTERLFNEYQSALAKSQAEAQALRAKLSSCLEEKSTLKQEVEEACKKLEMREKAEEDQISSAHAREASTLKTLRDLETQMSELVARKEEDGSAVATLTTQVMEAQERLMASEEENAQLCQDNENLSAFGAKQRKEMEELKQILALQKRDIRAALAVMTSFRSRARVAGWEDDAEEEPPLAQVMGEESSSTLEAIEQEMTDLDLELSKLQSNLH